MKTVLLPVALAILGAILISNPVAEETQSASVNRINKKKHPVPLFKEITSNQISIAELKASP